MNILFLGMVSTNFCHRWLQQTNRVTLSSLSIVLFLLQLNGMLLMILVTTIFMFCILILGKVKYENDLRKTRKKNQDNF